MIGSPNSTAVPRRGLKKPRSERGGSERGDEARLEGWGARRKTKRTYPSNTISADLFRPPRERLSP
jgi:hypothetical protein